MMRKRKVNESAALLSLNIWLLCVAMTGCDTKSTEPASATPPTITSPNELPQLPHVNVTQIEKWINFPLRDISQLTSLKATNSFYGLESYSKIPINCYQSWNLFGNVTIHDWPRESASSIVNFITKDGRVKLIIAQFYEFYPYDFAEDSIKNDIGHSLGLISDLRYRAGKYYAGKYPDALGEISNEIKRNCNEIDSKNNKAGYQCENFAISKMPSYITSFHWHLHAASLESDSPLSVEDWFQTLEIPSLPLMIEHEQGLDRPTATYGFYENQESITEFFKDIANFDEDCTQLL